MVRMIRLAMGFGLLVSVLAAAAAQDPRLIMETVKARSSAPDEQVEIRMRIVDSNGQVNERKATWFAQRIAPGSPEQRKLIRFHSPPELAKSGVLTHEKAKGDPDQWMYLPSVFTSRRIPSADRGDRYMGTTYSYEDIVSIRADQYAFKALPGEAIGGRRCAVIELVPVDEGLKRESGYSKTLNWVDTLTFVILKSEYYDRTGKVWKRYAASGVEQYGEHYRPAHTEMHDLKSGRATLIDYSGRKLNTRLADRLFTVRYLERGR